MATAVIEDDKQEGQHAVDDDAWGLEQVAPRKKGSFADISDCILLFGAFCNGNMGDVVQHISMRRLLASVAPPEQCFYYAHHRNESPSKGFRIGEFFGGDRSKLIKISTPTAWKVNRFKAFVIGGGGIFAAEHAPLFQDKFAEAVTVPIVVMGVGANYVAKKYSTLLQKAVFVSGRDTPSVGRFTDIRGDAATPAARPADVRLVRDPVLSDKELTDTTGACWTQSSGDHQQPLCFVLPAANSDDTVEMHRQFRASVVRQGDRFINVFPKHQEELAQFEYPGTVEEILDPMEYVKQLCSCKAIISTRFHGAILGLHMGVPTFGAFHVDSENKVPDLMVDTMALPDQFFLIDENLTREAVDRQVDTVRRLYEEEGRRGAIHDRLSVIHEEFQAEARHMFDVVGIARHQPFEQQKPVTQLQASLEDGERQQPQNDEEGAATGEPRSQGSPAADEGTAAPAVVAVVADASALSTLSPLPSGLPNPAKGGGHDSAVAVFLLFAIAGLASLPSTAGRRGRGSFRGRSGEASSVNLKPSNLLFALNFVLWIALAVAFSSYSKSYLRDTHDPVGLLALQGLTGSVVLLVLGGLDLGASDSPSPSDSSSGQTYGLRRLQMELTTASPRETLVAVLHSGQAFLTNFSLFVGGVAVTNALKAMEPVAAAVFSYLLLGKRVAPGGVAALVVTVAGILLLTFKGTSGGGSKDEGEATDTGGGGDRYSSSRILVSAAFTMAAVSCNALRNVAIKKGDPIPPHRTLFTCSVAAGMIGVALMVVRGVVRSMDELLIGGENGGVHYAARYGNWLSMDGVNAALCFVGYNFASFNLLACLSPVGHAVGNSVKRVVIFGSGIVLLGEVMSARQLAGAAVALVGVVVYNIAGKRK